MAENFCKSDVLMADPPLIESKRQTDELQTEVGHKRHSNHVEKFLLVVGISGKERVGVLCQVVGAMELP